MGTTISNGVTTLTPLLILGYESTATSQNIVHPIIGAQEPDVTLRAAGMRTGTLSFLFADQTSAYAAEQMHVAGGMFQLRDDDLDTILMAYVTTDKIVRTLDAEGRRRWTLAVDFQEVSG